MRVEKFPQVKAFADEMDVPRFADRFALLDRSLAAAAGGLFLEFGVHRGVSLDYIAERAEHIVYGFDSFAGPKEDWTPSYSAGHFWLEEPPQVHENAVLVCGWFEDTLKPFLMSHPASVAFAHLDADTYSATRYVLLTLAEHGRIVPGTVLQFDELFWKEDGRLYDDEYRAFREFQETFKVEIEGLGFCGSRGEPAEGAKFALQMKCLKL